MIKDWLISLPDAEASGHSRCSTAIVELVLIFYKLRSITKWMSSNV